MLSCQVLAQFRLEIVLFRSQWFAWDIAVLKVPSLIFSLWGLATPGWFHSSQIHFKLILFFPNCRYLRLGAMQNFWPNVETSRTSSWSSCREQRRRWRRRKSRRWKPWLRGEKVDFLFEGVENLGTKLWEGGAGKQKGASSKQRLTEDKSQSLAVPFVLYYPPDHSNLGRLYQRTTSVGALSEASSMPAASAFR